MASSFNRIPFYNFSGKVINNVSVDEAMASTALLRPSSPLKKRRPRHGGMSGAAEHRDALVGENRW
jgi:hypothetical protein